MTSLEAIETFRSWDGLARLDQILKDRRQKPNAFQISPRLFMLERLHSDVLAWLLGKDGSHDLGDRFAQRLLSMIFAQCESSPGAFVVSADVVTEFATGKGPIDILVHADADATSIVVGIENKIGSDVITSRVGPNQLQRYAAALVRRFPGAQVFLALLSPEDLEADVPDACSFATLTYKDVATALGEALSASADQQASEGQIVARHYLEALRTNIVRERDNRIDRILQEMYSSHREAWREIRRRLPSERDDAHMAIATAVCERLAETYGGSWQFLVKRERYVRVFRPGWSGLGYTTPETTVTGDNPYVGSRYPGAHFRLSMAPFGDDVAAGCGYEARLRVNGKSDAGVLISLRDALDRKGLLKPDQRSKVQFMVDFGSTSTLSSVIDNVVPGAVTQWYATAIEDAVAVLDECLGGRDV